jgi:hypothetical protein
MGVQRVPHPTGLAEVVDLILDKGLVIDIYVRVSLVGIELLTIDARIVVASVDTYLRFAEAVNRLDLTEEGKESETLPELVDNMMEGGAEKKTKGALEGAKGTLSDIFSGDDEDEEQDEDEDEDEGEDDEEERRPRRRRQPQRRRRRTSSSDGGQRRRRTRTSSRG